MLLGLLSRLLGARANVAMVVGLRLNSVRRVVVQWLLLGLIVNLPTCMAGARSKAVIIWCTVWVTLLNLLGASPGPCNCRWSSLCLMILLVCECRVIIMGRIPVSARCEMKLAAVCSIRPLVVAIELAVMRVLGRFVTLVRLS